MVGVLSSPAWPETELPASPLSGVLILYLALEVAFGILFRFYLVPRANRRLPSQPYRDYGRNRDQLLMRIMERLKATYDRQGRCFRKEIQSFLHAWCEPKLQGTSHPVNHKTKRANSSPPPSPLRLSHESMSTTSGGDDGDASLSSSDEEEVEQRRAFLESNKLSQTELDDVHILQGIHREEMDEFMSWALFEKEHHDLEEWERTIMAMCYERTEIEYGVRFAPGNGQLYKPRRLSLENVNALWRPLAVYVFFWFLSILGGLILRTFGFQRVASSRTGLTGWYRPAANQDSKLLPLLFFHGIAPAGLFFYLPMVLLEFTRDDRPVLLFENTNISCSIGFDALREAETVDGAIELVDRYIPKGAKLSLCGHSFGSCPLTWLLHSPAFRDRIQQFVLLDPVTILLHEPDVMRNFLYSKGCDKIRMMAGSELFTEYYLRRHFSWYNSDLWLDDIPDSVQVLIALSENDEIVNVPKVKKHVDIYENESCKVIYWPEAGHAKCVTSPNRWRQLKRAMLEQELKIAKST